MNGLSSLGSVLSPSNGVLVSLRRLNPVLERELRQRSRSNRLVIIMVVYLLVLSGVAYLTYLGETTVSSNSFSVFIRSIGRTMFEWVMILELVLLLFVIPAMTAGAITGERERQTLSTLQVTLVSPLGIFLGKMISSAAFILLLIVASTPVLAVTFVFGGVSIGQVLASMVTLLIIGLVFAAIGVSCSCLFRRTMTATLFSYGFVLIFTLGSLLAFVAINIFAVLLDPPSVDDGALNLSVIPLLFNPFVGLASIGGGVSSIDGAWPLTAIREGITGTIVGFNNLDKGPNALLLWAMTMAGPVAVACLMSWWGVLSLRTPTESL